jgi:Tol biopolymer transport system component
MRKAMSVRISIAVLVMGFVFGLRVVPACAELQQLTNSSEVHCGILRPTRVSDGALLFESDCDLTAGNPDRNREIFRRDASGSLSQLTDTSGCTNGKLSASASGAVFAFDSDCDFGTNADRNVEIVLVAFGELRSITSTSKCSSFAPSVSGNGTAVVFESDCLLVPGKNTNLNFEIFRYHLAGGLSELTDDRSASRCASYGASTNLDGSITTFASDCDLVGTNEDQVNEIFTVTAAGVISQLTQAPADTCLSTAASIDDTGTIVAFESSCDLTGSNPDESIEIFTSDGGALFQVSDDTGDPSCASGNASLSTDGNTVAFASYCDPLGTNADGSYEVFVSPTRSDDAVTQLSQATSCWNLFPTVLSADFPVAWVSNCNIGTNADGGDELFSGDGTCVCGAPATKGSRARPTAADALTVLRATVGAAACPLCACDVTGEARVTTSDALAILKYAVGQNVTFACD